MHVPIPQPIAAAIALALHFASAPATAEPVPGAAAPLLGLLAPPERANPTDVPVAAARAGVRAHPRDADRWHQLGESLEAAGQLDEAVDAYARAVRLPPRVVGRAYLYRDLAAALERQGDLPRALEAARTSVRSWPLSRDGLFCLGAEVVLLTRLLVKSGDLAGADAFYRPLAEAQPARDDCRAIADALEAAQLH